MTKPHRSEDAHAAGLYRAMALRFYSRYVDMRGHAAFAGGDLPDHGPLPTEAETDKRYEAEVEEWLFETPASTDAVLALVEFAGLIAADRLVGEITRDPVNDERDAFHQVIALAAVGGWLNDIVMREWVNRAKRETVAQISEDKRAMAERLADILFREGFRSKPKPSAEEGGAA